MSAEGDISVAEALQVLKKRALNDPSAPQAAAKVPKAQPAWEPPPLPPHRTGGQQQWNTGWRPPGGGSGPRAGPVAVARPPGLTGAAAGVRPGMPVPGPKAGPPGPLGVAAGAVPAGPVAGTDGKPLVAGNQAAFDIPQGKVGLLIGKQAATINAIKAICSVQCFVDQHTPDPDKARVTVVGATSETEKCKQIVLSLVSGSLTPAAVFQMSTSAPGAGAAAGPLPLPGGASGGATAGSAGTAPADLGKGQAPAAATPSSLVPAGLASGPGALPTAGGGTGPPSLPDLLPGSLPGSTSQNPLDALTASPANVGLAGAAAGLPTPALSAAAAGLTSAALPSAASLTGLASGLSLPPSNLQPPLRTGPGMLTRGEAQVQQDINEYYAQWWQQYATTVIPRAGQAAAESNQEEAAANAKQGNEPAAFDREALARLAAQAAAASSSQAPAAVIPADLASSEPRVEARGQQTDEADMELDEPAPRAQPPPQMKELPLPKPVSPPALPQPDLMPPISTLPPPTLQPPPAAPKPAAPVPAPQVPAVVAPKKEGFTGFGLTAAGPKILKDSDSVQKMLERLQGNVAQTKLPDSKLQPPVPVRVGPPGFDSTQANVTPANYTRAPADPELANLVQRIPDIKSSSEAEAFGTDAIARFPSFTAEQITDLLHKMDGITDLHTPEFLGELSKALTKRLNDFTSTQFSSLMSVFMLWSLDVGSSKRKSKVPARGPGSLPELCREFFVAAASEMSLRLMEFAPYELNCCLAAFVAVGFIEYKLFTSVGRAVLARHVSFGSQQLAALLTLLAELRLVHLDLLHSVGQFVAARAKEIRKLDALRVLRAFAKCNVRHDSLCQGIGNEIVEQVREKGAESGWRVEDLCEVAWVFCVLQTYHEPLFRLMLEQLARTPKVAADALCMLYECHLVLDSEHKEAYAKYRVEHETVQALLDHYKEHRKDSRRCSEHQRSDVANVLKSLVEGTVNVAHRTSIGLLVDVAALRKKSSSDGFIHIELDSPMTVVRPLDQDEAAAPSLIMEGPVALKRRLLQKHGLHLITVRESEWRDLGENRDKKRHLRSLLSSLSDILE